MRIYFFVVIVALLVGCGDKEQTKNDAAVDTSTGSGSDASGTADTPTGDGANAVCTDCAMTTCSTTYTACQNDADCTCIYNCYTQQLGGEGYCKSTMCTAPNNMPWSDLIGCLDTMCTCP